MGDLGVTGEAIATGGRASSGGGGQAGPEQALPLRRIASNFAVLGVAEVVCRGCSVLATLALTRRLRPAGYGRVEFAFNVVFWLVLIVRDCFETIVTREVARHPRITRSLVNHVLAVKLRAGDGVLRRARGRGFPDARRKGRMPGCSRCTGCCCSRRRWGSTSCSGARTGWG